MRFSLGIVFGFFLLSNLYGRGGYHVHRSYDLGSNGQKEVLVLNTSNFSAVWVETFQMEIMIHSGHICCQTVGHLLMERLLI